MNRAVRASLSRRLALAGLMALAAGGTAMPDVVSPDHEDALKARARGEIRSLEEIIESLKVHKYDRLVDVQIYKRGNRWIYELTWLTKAGRYRIFTVDAAHAVVLKDEVK
ncbi:MAG: hypothetical protein P4L82_05285 [Ancalomicrobiaceae bacterium]|nr:hypothetical protein [Ancalomicrobiaceae bacterium]